MSIYFDQLNYWAILVSALAYSFLGFIWFTLLFGKTWFKELKKHGITIKEPSKGQLATKIIITFVLNLLIAIGVSIFTYLLDTFSLGDGIALGLALGLFFSAFTLALAFNWESRSLKLTLIDIAYPILGITLCSIILTLWR